MASRVLGVVVNFNRADLAARTATDLVHQRAGGGELSVLVLDNGSITSDYEELAASTPPRATLIRLQRNGGYAAACNFAAKYAAEHGFEFVWILNSDLRIPDRTLSALVALLQSEPLAAAAVPVAITASTPPTILSAGVSVGMWTGAIRHHLAGHPVEDLPTQPLAVDAIEGAAMMIRVAAFEDVGPFDEDYFMYWEDTDWSVRARRRGYLLLVASGALVTHDLGLSSTPVLRMQYILTNRVRFMRTHAGVAQLTVFTCFFLLVWLPLYTLLRLIPRFGPRAAVRIAAATVATNTQDAIVLRAWRRRAVSRARRGS